MAKVDVKFSSKKMESFFIQVEKNNKSAIDLKRAFAAAIVSPIMRDITKNFEKESGPKGRWKKWSSSYTKAMNKIGKGSNKILQDTGALKRGLKPVNWRKDREGLVVFNDEKTKSGFPYAFAHNEGGPKLPERHFMWISTKAFNQVAKTTAKFIMFGVIR